LFGFASWPARKLLEREPQGCKLEKKIKEGRNSAEAGSVNVHMIAVGE